MLQFIKALNLLLPLTYAVCLFLYGYYFKTKKTYVAKSASFVLLLSICLHISFLFAKGILFQYFPINNTFESLSMLALNIAIIYFVIENIKKESTTGVFFLSIIMIFQTISSKFFKKTVVSHELLSDPTFGIHTTFTLLGFSALAISSLYGLMYWMLMKEIKKRHFGIIYDGLPPLETLEEMEKYGLYCGILLLGIGILLGHFYAYKINMGTSFFDVKIAIAHLGWLSYAVVGVMVQRYGLRGLRLSLITFWGFIIFLTAIKAANFIGNSFHRFI